MGRTRLCQNARSCLHTAQGGTLTWAERHPRKGSGRDVAKPPPPSKRVEAVPHAQGVYSQKRPRLAPPEVMVAVEDEKLKPPPVSKTRQKLFHTSQWGLYYIEPSCLYRRGSSMATV